MKCLLLFVLLASCSTSEKVYTQYSNNVQLNNGTIITQEAQKERTKSIYVQKTSYYKDGSIKTERQEIIIDD